MVYLGYHGIPRLAEGEKRTAQVLEELEAKNAEVARLQAALQAAQVDHRPWLPISHRSTDLAHCSASSASPDPWGAFVSPRNHP